MDKQLSAHQFEDVFTDLGYDLNKLGCIMLDIDASGVADGAKDVIPKELLYTSPDEDKYWIKGFVAEDNAHVTLLYGLLQPGMALKKHVDTLLKDATPDEVEIDNIGFFASPESEDEEYWTIVAHIKPTAALKEANERLRMLPHIETYPRFKPHMTLAYIHSDETKRDEVIKNLNDLLSGLVLFSKKLNYGDTKR